MSKLNYEKLISATPHTIYGEMVNSKGQKIVFIEHPIYGDEHTVIAICDELKLAASTEFFELDDMMADHKEYEPYFDTDGILQYGAQVLDTPSPKYLETEAWKQQLELAKEIVAIGINIVTCGNCGDVMLHRLSDEEIKCPYCLSKGEPSDFPDFFY